MVELITPADKGLNPPETVDNGFVFVQRDENVKEELVLRNADDAELTEAIYDHPIDEEDGGLIIIFIDYCHDCGKDISDMYPQSRRFKYCNECSEHRAMKNLSQMEPPDGGWPRNSDIDKL